MTSDDDGETEGDSARSAAQRRNAGTDAVGTEGTDDPDPDDAGRSGTTRRAVVAALVGGGAAAGALSPVGRYVERVAPLSGGAWRSTGDGPGAVESPHGTASVTYDDYHVPHVEADTEAAAYFAVGHVHAADRLFQMDLFRRQASGRLSELVGAGGAGLDIFARKMDFEAAAAASRRAIAGTQTSRVAAAYADGVTAYVEQGSPGTEFGLLGYEPEPWDVLDTLLVLTGFAWRLSGSFSGLRRAVTRRTFDDALHDQLYPRQLDHGASIVRDRGSDGDSAAARRPGGGAERLDPAVVDWLSGFEADETLGSNAWTVSGEHTESGEPILASDPHLALRAPPNMYEQRVTIGDRTVAGATVPGFPFVIIGRNDHGAWGLTNAGNVDVLDAYTYEVEGEQYRYRGEWRSFDTETRTIRVARGDDREVTVRKTVHGPVVEPPVGDAGRVGVAWVGLTGTRELQAWHEMGNGTTGEQFAAAVRKLDGLPLNVHYADRDGHTGYRLGGKIPIRRVDGEVVDSVQVFDGSAGEAEWTGFEPYGESTWDGFVPFAEKPSATDAGYVASANQRTAESFPYPVVEQGADGFRAQRIYERLDGAAESGTSVDRTFAEELQLDTLDLRARAVVPAILDARDAMPDAAAPWLEAFEGWDYRMDRDSRAALAFKQFMRRFREITWSGFFGDYDLDPRYWPSDRVLLDLPPDSEVFDGDRAAVMAEAMADAVDHIQREGWETYGDHNVTAIDHPLGALEPGLNYERLPTDGAGKTVRVFSPRGFGPNYRLVADLAGETRSVLAGGNDGAYGADHYEDQLRLWADGEYTRLDRTPSGTPDLAFEEGNR
jgi:penicillin amidase